MPAVFLDRLPLPSLQVYAVGSVLLLACSVHYAVQVVTTAEFESRLMPGNGTAATTEEYRPYRNSTIGVQRDIIVLDIGNDEGLILARIIQVLHFMLQEPMCIWTLINMAYCCFILIGKTIQKLVFGDLRVSEQQHIKDKFWNFVFYKFIFIFGVMNVQYMDEVVLWCSWFSILGFLHLLAQLCKDRCEYLSFSPATPKWTHCRVLTLLIGILTISLSLFGLCTFVGLHAGINTFAFMAAENSLVTVRTLYVIVRYSVYLCDVRHKGAWEKRASYIYYSELIFELAALTIDFLHHLHMLVWGNIFLSMASLVIAMQLRCLFYEIRHRVKKYSNYLRIVKYMEFNYPMATCKELENNNDDCAICWDHLDSARKLPCGHLFHNSCLRSWLEQDTSCPTCRKSLNDSVEKVADSHRQRNAVLSGLSLQDNSTNQTTNHFFHFDGSRYISWLPSFFVEVSHTNGIAERQMSAVQSSQLDHMAHQVQQMFPHMPLSVILDDLWTTKSVESTVENILDGKVVVPPGSRNQSGSNNQASDYSQSASYLGGQRENLLCSDQLNFIEDAVFSPGVYTDVIDDISRFTSTMHSAPPLGCRFSKSPEEREQMLAERKDNLIKIAKRKYLEKRQVQDMGNES